MKSSFLAAFLLSNFLLVGCQSQAVQSRWSEAPISIDGVSDDWPEEQLTYFEDSRMMAGIMNDQNSLYLLFQTRDRSFTRRSPFTPMTVWFDVTVRKKKNLGISYPGYSLNGKPGRRRVATEDLRDGFWQSLTEEQRERLKDKRAEMHDMIRIIDKTRDKEELVPPDGEKGPAMAYTFEEDGFRTYELRVPLHKAADDKFGLGAKPGDKIAIGIEPGVRTLENGRGRAGGGRPGVGGPGGVGPGGRFPDGMGRGGMTRQPAGTSPEFWVTVVLGTMPKD